MVCAGQCEVPHAIFNLKKAQSPLPSMSPVPLFYLSCRSWNRSWISWRTKASSARCQSQPYGSTQSWSFQKDIAASAFATSLNHCIIRPTFDYTTPQAVRTIPTGKKFFTLIDALKSYHQVELNEESSAMTTFSTPFGRYNSYRKFSWILSTKNYNRQFCSGMAEINKRSGNIKQIKSWTCEGILGI